MKISMAMIKDGLPFAVGKEHLVRPIWELTLGTAEYCERLPHTLCGDVLYICPAEGGAVRQISYLCIRSSRSRSWSFGT